MKISTILLIPALTGFAIHSQPVFYDSKAPQVAFAVSEIHRAGPAKDRSRDRAIRELTSDSSTLGFVIAADGVESSALARSLGVAPLKQDTPQSYAIRRREQRGRVTIAVLGADPTGAMY